MTRSCGVVLLVAVCAAGCREGSSGRGLTPSTASLAASPASTTSAGAAPASTSSAAGVASTALAAAPLGPPPPLMGPAFRLQVARAFAPQLRFNAYHPGHAAPQNRHEDLFPMGVASFLREIESGQVRVLVRGSRGNAVGESWVRAARSGPAVFTADRIAPYPEGMVGDPPGDAPLYVHVYERTAARVLDAQGRGQVELHLEYWVFYPQDRADVQILGGQLPQDLFGHQGDWEHIEVRAQVDLGVGSRFVGGRVLEGFYAAHGDLFSVARPELELVDDAGRSSPDGRHPVVYVAQGKHGSYPQAGERRDLPLPAAIANYVDLFRGNGVVVSAWAGPLFDLEDAASAPDEFASPAFRAMTSGPSAPSLADWTAFRGRWGPTRHRLQLGSRTIALASSPTGPKAKSDYGDFGRSATPWTQAKQQGAGTLRIYRDVGQVFPQVLPPPLPLRS